MTHCGTTGSYSSLLLGPKSFRRLALAVIGGRCSTSGYMNGHLIPHLQNLIPIPSNQFTRCRLCTRTGMLLALYI